MTLTRSQRALAGGLIALVFLASLPLHAALDGRTPEDVLLIGLAGIVIGQVGWFANLPIVVGVIMLLAGRKVALKLAIPAAALAMSSFLWSSMPNDSPTPTHILRHGAGYYLWLASALGLLLVSILERWAPGQPRFPARGHEGGP